MSEGSSTNDDSNNEELVDNDLLGSLQNIIERIDELCEAFPSQLHPLMMLTAEDLQNIFEISERKSYELMSSQGFPSVKLGNSNNSPRRTPLLHLMEWLDENCTN
jgi:hypothetical protein